MTDLLAMARPVSSVDRGSVTRLLPPRYQLEIPEPNQNGPPMGGRNRGHRNASFDATGLRRCGVRLPRFVGRSVRICRRPCASDRRTGRRLHPLYSRHEGSTSRRGDHQPWRDRRRRGRTGWSGWSKWSSRTSGSSWPSRPTRPSGSGSILSHVDRLTIAEQTRSPGPLLAPGLNSRGDRNAEVQRSVSRGLPLGAMPARI